MAQGLAWDMKEQGAIGKTGHQWGYFFIRTMGKERGTWKMGLQRTWHLREIPV